MLMPSFLRLSSTFPATGGRVRSQRSQRGQAESLEVRSLLSATAWPGLSDPQLESSANETLDAAHDLGSVRAGDAAEFIGAIGNSTAASTDVDWLRFTLDASSRVQITALPNVAAVSTPVVLTLYGDQLAEPDPAVPTGHRLLARREATAGLLTRLDANLSAGTYFVAVSGAGNRFFHPFLADSGLSGTAGDYGLRIAVAAGSAARLTSSIIPEAGRGGNDTPRTAIDLGTLAGDSHRQIEGTIGDDPYYNARSLNPLVQNPAADVDLYHFRIEGAGRFSVVAEAFAGRIDSALDPALTLFQADAGGSLRRIAANNNTLNPAETTNGLLPLFSDSVLFAGLTAGDYFVAVSSAGNDAESGPDGVFDPRVAHSGGQGGSVGNYALDVQIAPDNAAPSVLAASISAGATLDTSPTQLSIQFSEPVNAQILAYLESQESDDQTARPVFVQAADGTRFFPRLQSYDVNSGVARFLMLDALANGSFELHVSSSEGLTDLAGLPIQANAPSGDFVIPFTVAGPVRGSAAGATTWLNGAANDSAETAQSLGVLFPHELQNGVTVSRNATTNALQSSDTADHFRLELLQSRTVVFSLQNTGSASGARLEVLDANGQPRSLLSLADGTLRLGFLPTGTYTLRATGWTADNFGDVTYDISIRLLGASENPTPLTVGAAPAAGIHLRGNSAPILVTPPAATNEATFVAIMPAGLLQGLNAPAAGQSNVTSPSLTPDTAIVRLFGFGDRDRLFTLIDSALRFGSRNLEVTQAELTDAELLDLRPRDPDRTTDAETETSEESNETSTLEATEPSLDRPATRTDAELTPRQPVSRGGARRRLTPASIAPATLTEDQPPAANAPLAVALAASLAQTLRERSRRQRATPV